ncbi:hypothetical protein O181_026320 [Austropuccinia psidii MF-1]|uniref:PH domain-containing protein n=1 Tax=Austropuccinia psidii MF-1 TaxID=1389203 RepID=A0A9Q3CP58_9BASI|nr:hypothetical protein [Austropuccinia psidii MF-1]
MDLATLIALSHLFLLNNHSWCMSPSHALSEIPREAAEDQMPGLRCIDTVASLDDDEGTHWEPLEIRHDEGQCYGKTVNLAQYSGLATSGLKKEKTNWSRRIWKGLSRLNIFHRGSSKKKPAEKFEKTFIKIRSDRKRAPLVEANFNLMQRRLKEGAPEELKEWIQALNRLLNDNRSGLYGLRTEAELQFGFWDLRQRVDIDKYREIAKEVLRLHRRSMVDISRNLEYIKKHKAAVEDFPWAIDILDATNLLTMTKRGPLLHTSIQHHSNLLLLFSTDEVKLITKWFEDNEVINPIFQKVKGTHTENEFKQIIEDLVNIVRDQN